MRHKRIFAQSFVLENPFPFEIMLKRLLHHERYLVLDGITVQNPFPLRKIYIADFAGMTEYAFEHLVMKSNDSGTNEVDTSALISVVRGCCCARIYRMIEKGKLNLLNHFLV